MGFITPGKSIKKRKLTKSKKYTRSDEDDCDLRRKVPNQSRSKLVPASPTQEQSQFVFKSLKPVITKSIIESFPLELIHEIFIHSNLSHLPFLSKSLNSSLKFRYHLGLSVLQQNFYDLNSSIPELNQKYPTRFALSEKVLNHRFVTLKLLEKFDARIDLILDHESIVKETQQRLKTHKSDVMEKEKERLRQLSVTNNQINDEMAQRAEEAFNRLELHTTDSQPEENSDDYLEFPQRFQFELNEEKIALVKYFATKNLRYKNCSVTLSNLIKERTPVKYLKIIMESSTTTQELKSVGPLIESLRCRPHDAETTSWLISLLSDSQKNDDDLWTFIVQENNIEFFSLIENSGGNPSPNVIRMMASIRNGDSLD